MAQLHFTLDSDFFVGLFSETKDEAFGKLMEALLNKVFVRMFLRFRIMRYGTGYAIPHFLSRE